jgi:hypothetical protein
MTFKGGEGVDWINLAQDKETWRAVLKAIMDLRGYINCGEFLDWLGGC